MLDAITNFFVGIVLGFGALLGIHEPEPEIIIQEVAAEEEPMVGGFNPTGGGTYRLQSSISSTQTTITLSSFKEPISNIKYTMAYLNSDKGYGTIEPGNTTRSEFISFTGVTQNADNTATLTGVTRGLTRTPAGSSCTASTTLAAAHSGQSVFILSDSPCLFAEYAVKSNNETITGQWTFNTFPITATNSTSSYAAAGISQLATPSQQAAGTATSTGGNEAPLVLASKNATSTYATSTAPNSVIVTRADGTIDPKFFGTTTVNLYGDLAVTGTTSGIHGNKFNLNLSPTTPTGASTTIFALSVPANTLSTGNYIKTTLYLSAVTFAQSGSCSSSLEIAYGTGSTTLAFPSNKTVGSGYSGKFEFILAANGATNSQKLAFLIGDDSATTTQTSFKINTLSQDSTQNKQLTFIGLSGCTITPEIVTSELYN